MVSGTFLRVTASVLVMAGLGFGSAQAADDAKQLNVYNWVDYIGPSVLAGFEKETGIKVNYDTYDANETLEAKLAAGNSGYDIVVPSLSPFLARQVKAGFYAKLDKAKLSNYDHLDKTLLQRMAKYDMGNAYAIPWTTGTDGIGYNVEKIKAILPDAPVDSMRMIFDPEIVAKFKGCGVSMLDSPNDIFPQMLAYLGLNPDSQDPKDLQKAADALLKIRPYIRKFDSSEYINDLANGDLCLSLGFSSDINIARRRAKEANKGVTLNYTIPKEGAQRWIDTMAIPKDAPHLAAALQFMNYILDPKVAADTGNAVFIQTGNADAKGLIKPEIVGDPGVFPPETVEAKLFSISVSTPEIDRLRTRLWTKIKTNR